ncbi:MchC protein [Serratia marcescens]|nr:MchC protein [Serratia marcescens]
MTKLAMLHESLIPFVAKKTGSQLLWHNALSPAEQDELKKETSYLIEENNRHAIFDDGTPRLNDEKVFFAERYGGGAISRNGGGARCGFDGRWQVKGIGANALVGQGAKHVDGELTMTGAVLEALWGNVMAKLLPYGAVPNKAILLTDSPLAAISPESARSPHNRKALLVREPVVRPAHFCRAPYYHPHDAMQRQPSDIQRVEKLIVAAPAFLPRPPEFDAASWLALPQEEQAFYGLCELARRLATQIAYCRTRHLVMMTSPSNCDMAGRLLDFHGVRSVFPAERRDPGRSYIQHNKLNEDAPLLLRGLQDLAFYLAKHQFGPAFLAAAHQGIGAAFNMAYKRACLLDNLGMAGFDPAFLQRLPLTAEWFALGERLQKMFDLAPGVFTRRQGLGLGNAHPAIALLHRLIDAPVRVPAEQQGTTAEERFSLAFRRLYTQYLQETSAAQTSAGLQLAMKQTVTRRLGSRTFMRREVIFQEIAGWRGEVSEITEQLQTYLDRFERQAINVLQ